MELNILLRNVSGLNPFTMNTIGWLILGLILGAVLLVYARSYGARAEKKILAQALIVAAIIYVLFAIVWGNTTWLLIEISGVAVYGVFAWASIRHSTYWLAIGWLLHPIWDVVLHLLGSGHMVAPEWYVVACITFDILVSGYIFTRAPFWQPISTKV